MFKRFKISITEPSKIGLFLKDSYLKVLLYTLLLAIICSIPSIISNSRKGEFTPVTTNEILTIYKKALSVNNEETALIPNSKIVDYKLEGNEGGFIAGNIGFWFKKPKEIAYLNVIFLEDRVSIALSNVEFRSYSYETLALDNIDFLNLDKNNIEFLKVTNSLEYIVNDLKPIWLSALIFDSIFTFFLDHLLAALLISIVMSFGTFIPLRFIFKMSLFSATITQVFNLCSFLFNFELLVYIGYILGFMFLKRSMRHIVAVKR